MSSAPGLALSSSLVRHACKAVLFDMDGTLIDSSPAVVCAWELMRETYPHIDLDHILKSAHGYRTVDALRHFIGIEDPEVLAKEVPRFEKAILAAAKEKGDAAHARGEEGGIVRLPGVGELIKGISVGTEERGGRENWGVCTSSTFFYASQALPTARIPTPKVFVTAESVKRGKPMPDPYLLGAELSGVSPFDCVVVEDAPTGIRSGKASGAIVIATCTSHTRESLEAENPDYLVEDLSHVQAIYNASGELTLLIDQPTDRTSSPATPDITPLQTPAISRVPSAEKIFFAKTPAVTGSGRTDVKLGVGSKLSKTLSADSDDSADDGAKNGVVGMNAF